jgi:hypothetical protein
MKWHIFVKGCYIGTVAATLAEIRKVLRRPHIVMVLSHSIDIL